VFDEVFFGSEFPERVQEFSREHGGLGVRVDVVTLSGERLDALEIVAVEAGARLVTREERLVFLPYAQIAHVDVSLLRDHRMAGFEFPPSSA
jgi:hypothetical protein